MGARWVGQLLARDVAAHVGLEVEHPGDRRPEVVGLVPRQPAGHREQVAHRDRGAVVVPPLRSQVVVVEAHLSLRDQASDDQAGHALAHRPAQLRRRGVEPVGVALGHQLAVLQDQHRARPELLARRLVEVVAEGACHRGLGVRGGPRLRHVGVRVGRRHLEGVRQLGRLVGQGAAEPVGGDRALPGEHAQDRAPDGAVVRGRRPQHRHQRVGREVVLGVVAARDRLQCARVVGGVPGAGQEQRTLPPVAGHEGDDEEQEEAQHEPPHDAHGAKATTTPPHCPVVTACWCPCASPRTS